MRFRAQRSEVRTATAAPNCNNDRRSRSWVTWASFGDGAPSTELTKAGISLRPKMLTTPSFASPPNSEGLMVLALASRTYSSVALPLRYPCKSALSPRLSSTGSKARTASGLSDIACWRPRIRLKTVMSTPANWLSNSFSNARARMSVSANTKRRGSFAAPKGELAPTARHPRSRIMRRRDAPSTGDVRRHFSSMVMDSWTAMLEEEWL